MRHSAPPAPTSRAARPKPSPLMMCDSLISLAQDADRAGLSITADRLVHLAHAVLEEGRPQQWAAANRN